MCMIGCNVNANFLGLPSCENEEPCGPEIDKVNTILIDIDFDIGIDIYYKSTDEVECGVISIADSYSVSCVPREWCGQTKEFDGDLVFTSCLLHAMTNIVMWS